MKRKQVYLLLGVAVILGILALLLQNWQSGTWKKEAANRQIFTSLPINDVTKIQVQAGNTKLTLQLVGDAWQVAERYGYPADFGKISELLRTLWDLKYVREMQIGSSQFGRLQLLPPGQREQSGTQVDLIGVGDKKIASIVLGKKQAGNDDAMGAAGSGRFVLNPDQKDRAYLIDDSFSSLDSLNPSEWLRKQFIDTQKLRSVIRGNVGNAPGWKVNRKDDRADWELQDAAANETLEKETVGPLSSLSLSLQDVRQESAPVNETGLQQPLVVELETFDGFHYHLEIGGSGPEQTHFLRVKVSANLPTARTPVPNEPAEDKKKKDDEFNKQLEQWKTRLADEQKLEHWIFLVSDWSLEPLLKNRADFAKKAEPSAVAPSPTPNASPAPSSSSATPSPSPSPTDTPRVYLSPNPSTMPSPAATPTKNGTALRCNSRWQIADRRSSF
jgi:Domain of unknown function (DUF4340)